jgi:hypothetical protein
MSQPRPKIFISYSHKDESLKDELVAHFKVLQDAAGLVEVWDDERIGAGQAWKEEIKSPLTKIKLL